MFSRKSSTFASVGLICSPLASAICLNISENSSKAFRSSLLSSETLLCESISPIIAFNASLIRSSCLPWLATPVTILRSRSALPDLLLACRRIQEVGPREPQRSYPLANVAPKGPLIEGVSWQRVRVLGGVLRHHVRASFAVVITCVSLDQYGTDRKPASEFKNHPSQELNATIKRTLETHR